MHSRRLRVVRSRILCQFSRGMLGKERMPGHIILEIMTGIRVQHRDMSGPAIHRSPNGKRRRGGKLKSSVCVRQSARRKSKDNNMFSSAGSVNSASASNSTSMDSNTSIDTSGLSSRSRNTSSSSNSSRSSRSSTTRSSSIDSSSCSKSSSNSCSSCSSSSSNHSQSRSFRGCRTMSNQLQCSKCQRSSRSSPGCRTSRHQNRHRHRQRSSTLGCSRSLSQQLRQLRRFPRLHNTRGCRVSLRKSPCKSLCSWVQLVHLSLTYWLAKPGRSRQSLRSQPLMPHGTTRRATPGGTRSQMSSPLGTRSQTSSSLGIRSQTSSSPLGTTRSQTISPRGITRSQTINHPPGLPSKMTTRGTSRGKTTNGTRQITIPTVTRTTSGRNQMTAQQR
mmetsp:Transcript_118628/g.205220  ORF Transcript_118628/g.205220 Transcript_118628/m.205220 type:complete len:389 (+) Transcript_118628:971-2137(+)